ncbi:MAG: GNAT family N-acetyltransferase [Burkholderiales bacterium]|nr:GNAT family N-acetyltransferase [Burkholderiales bacterium]
MPNDIAVIPPTAVYRLMWNPPLSPVVVAGIVRMINSTVPEGGTLGYAQPLDQHTAAGFIESLDCRIQGGDTHMLMGMAGSEPAFFVLMTQSGMPNCRHRAELSKGVVYPSHRGRGLLRLALAEIVARAHDLGVEQFELDVRENSRAHRLWQQMGFSTWGVVEDYARVNGRVHRGHYMRQSVVELAERLRLQLEGEGVSC